MSRARPAALLAALALPLLAACGTGRLGTGADFSVESALGALPDVAGEGRPVHVVVGDLAALHGGAGAARREDPARWLAPLRSTGTTGLLPEELAVDRLGSGEVRDVLGFDARDVVSYAALQGTPDSLAVLSTADGTGLRRGVRATGDGEPGDVVRRSAAFPVVLGTGTRDGQVALGRSARVLVDWADKGATLADEDDLARVARALDGEDVVAAELVAPAGRLDAIGAGQQVRGGRVTTWVACASDDPRALAADVRRRWRDDAALSGAARLGPVTTGDGVVLVGLTPRTRPDAVLGLLQRGKLPFATPVTSTEKD